MTAVSPLTSATLVGDVEEQSALDSPEWVGYAVCFSQAGLMAKTRWLCLVAVGLLFSFAALAPPHTVHHGLHVVDLNECPVLAATSQTIGEPLETLLLRILLPSSQDIPILDPILLKKLVRQVYRTRSPPSSLPV